MIITSLLCQCLHWIPSRVANQIRSIKTVISGGRDCIVFYLHSVVLPICCSIVSLLSCPFISPSPLAGQRGPHISPRDSCPNKPLHSLWPLEGERQLTIHFHQSICALLELTLNTGDTLASHWSPDEYIILRMPGKGWEGGFIFLKLKPLRK